MNQLYLSTIHGKNDFILEPLFSLSPKDLNLPTTANESSQTPLKVNNTFEFVLYLFVGIGSKDYRGIATSFR